MSQSDIYRLIAIGVLVVVVVAALILGRRAPQQRLSPLTGFAFGFIIAGILFGDNPLIGFTMIGIGLVLAIVDIFLNRRK